MLTPFDGIGAFDQAFCRNRALNSKGPGRRRSRRRGVVRDDGR